MSLFKKICRTSMVCGVVAVMLFIVGTTAYSFATYYYHASIEPFVVAGINWFWS